MKLPKECETRLSEDEKEKRETVTGKVKKDDFGPKMFASMDKSGKERVSY